MAVLHSTRRNPYKEVQIVVDSIMPWAAINHNRKFYTATGAVLPQRIHTQREHFAAVFIERWRGVWRNRVARSSWLLPTMRRCTPSAVGVCRPVDTMPGAAPAQKAAAKQCVGKLLKGLPSVPQVSGPASAQRLWGEVARAGPAVPRGLWPIAPIGRSRRHWLSAPAARATQLPDLAGQDASPTAAQGPRPGRSGIILPAMVMRTGYTLTRSLGFPSCSSHSLGL
jgi:hypothetical protein